MIVNSKQLIRSAGLDKHKFDPVMKLEVGTHKASVEDIDRRYRVEFGTLEIKTKKDNDNPTGFHIVAEGEQKEDEYENINGQAIAPDAALDAVTKGKGKGKGKNDGRCNIWNGEGPFARDCPSTPPVPPPGRGMPRLPRKRPL